MKYRTTGAWGAGEGRKLTAAEVDGNFYEHASAIDALEALSGAPSTISNIVVTGTQMTIVLASGATFGPFTLPTAVWRDRGAWAASTAYYANDIVSVAGTGIFHVLADHTSESSFSATAPSGAGTYYQLLISMPNPAPVFNVTDASFVPTITHANGYIRCNTSGGTIVYWESGVFPVPTEMHFRQVGLGGISIVVGSSGLVINTPQGTDAETNTVGGVMTVKQVSDTELDVFGTLAAVTA